MDEEKEYQIRRNVNDNSEYILGFMFDEDWKQFFSSFSTKLKFIEDDDYNFKYSSIGKLGISLENDLIHVWFEENKFSTHKTEEIIKEFCDSLIIRYGNEIEYSEL